MLLILGSWGVERLVEKLLKYLSWHAGIHFDFEAEFIVDSMNRSIFLGKRVTLHAFSPFPPDNGTTSF